MSHAEKADELLIKPAAGARPASPRCPDGSFARHAKRPVTRRVTSSTTTTRLATASDRPTQPSLTVTRASEDLPAERRSDAEVECFLRRLGGDYLRETNPGPCVRPCISYHGGGGCRVATSDPIAEII